VQGAIDLVHNAVVPADGGCWLHRKGAAPAGDGEITVVLGSRGTPSWVMRGAGSERGLCSVAHGAGRRMGRSEAVAKLRDRLSRKGLRRTALGGRVLCDRTELLYAEHPMAYKDIGSVVAAIEAEGLATPVAALHPRVTVKR